ncbi:MAG: glycosyltransferase family 2 protein [Bacilli bacterium]|jgi:glycosyltransferase EpsH
MQNTNISFLIATKNCEKFISRCLQSVLRVILPEDEIIVCDCSSDKTMSIIKSFENQFRINYVPTTGKGIYADRIALADAAIKDFIYYVDADDEIIVDEFLKTRKILAATRPDILFACFRVVDENDHLLECKNFIGDRLNVEKEEVYRIFFSYVEMLSALWEKIVKREVFKSIKQDSFMIDEIDYGEDRDMSLLCIKNAHSFVFSHNEIYKYYLMSGSATKSTYTLSHIKSYLNYIDRSYQFLNDNNLYSLQDSFFEMVGANRIFLAIRESYLAANSAKEFRSYRKLILSSSAYKNTRARRKLSHVKKFNRKLYLFFHLGFYSKRLIRKWKEKKESYHG